MSILDDFLEEVRRHPKWQAVAADPHQAEALADVEAWFAILESHADSRVITLYDRIAGIVGAKHRPIKNRLDDLHAAMQAALPWIKAMADKMSGTTH